MLSHKTLFWMLLIVKVCSPIKQFNWSCQSLKTLEGNFKYPIDARNATEFDIVLQNKTVIARWIKNVDWEFGKIWVKAVDSTSITLHQCHNLTLHKQYPQNDEESIYNMRADEKSYEPSTATPAEENENPDSFPPWRTAGIVCCSLVALTVLAALAYRKNGKNGLVNSESSLANFQNLENNNLQGDSQTEGAREPGQYFGEEEECKRPKKGNAEQTGAGMLEHGDCTNRDVVSGDAVEAHSPQDDPLVEPNKEERRPEHSRSCGVAKTRNGPYQPIFQKSVNNKLEGVFNADRARDPGQDANNQNDVYINMPERCQREEVQAREDGRPEGHHEQTPFLHPDPGEPGQYFGEEEECKRPKKGNAEQTGAGMLEHGDCTNRDVVSGDAVEAHSPQGGKALRTLSVLWRHKDQWQRKERQYEELRWNREDTGGTAQQRGVGWDNDK